MKMQEYLFRTLSLLTVLAAPAWAEEPDDGQPIASSGNWTVTLNPDHGSIKGTCALIFKDSKAKGRSVGFYTYSFGSMYGIISKDTWHFPKAVSSGNFIFNGKPIKARLVDEHSMVFGGATIKDELAADVFVNGLATGSFKIEFAGNERSWLVNSPSLDILNARLDCIDRLKVSDEEKISSDDKTQPF